MAYGFVAANTRYLSCGSAPVTAAPLTLAAWFRRGSISGTPSVLCLGNNATGVGHAILISIRSNGALSAGAFDGSFSQSVTTTITTQDAWHHGAAVFSSNSSRIIYLDGNAATENTTTHSPLNINRTGIAATPRDTPADLYNGQIAEVGIWSVALTAAEAASLADGMSCDKVRPQNLVFYAPLVRDLIDQKGGLTITNNNTATVANHPRVYA